MRKHCGQRAGSGWVTKSTRPRRGVIRLCFQQLKRMLSALEAKVGNDYLLAVTADHGMPSEPSSPDRRHFAPSIVDLLHEKFDPEAKQLIRSFEAENGQIFVDEDRLSHLGLTLRDLAHFLESQPFLFAVFTNDDVRSAANALRPATQRHSKYEEKMLKK